MDKPDTEETLRLALEQREACLGEIAKLRAEIVQLWADLDEADQNVLDGDLVDRSALPPPGVDVAEEVRNARANATIVERERCIAICRFLKKRWGGGDMGQACIIIADEIAETPKLADQMFNAQHVVGAADSAFFDACRNIFGVDELPFEGWHVDDYDQSFELDDAQVGLTITAEQLAQFWAHGFARCWVNRTDGSEWKASKTHDGKETKPPRSGP